MKKFFSVVILNIIMLSMSPLVSNAEVLKEDVSQAYENGIVENIINPNDVSFEEFNMLCENSVIPVYNHLKNEDPTLNFFDFIRKDNYEQPQVDNEVTRSSPFLRYNTTSASKAYSMKAGDILICYGANITGKYVGHAAIATSDKYVLEMQGPGHKSVHTDKKTFFKRNTGKGKYVLTYRIKKHPNYAKKAASYAWNHMYKQVKPKYFVSTRLYNKDPSYCSKYVYLSYYWGATKKSVKKWTEYTHIVTPHGLTGNLVGDFKPNCIHKITSY